MTIEHVDARLVLLVGVLSIAGHVLHNLAEFPPVILLAPETLFPVGVTVLFLAWLLGRPSRLAFLATAGWAGLVIVGAGLTVLPLSALPFTPEQTVTHYAAHLVYALAQVPLLWVAGRVALGTRSPTGGVRDPG